MLASEVLQQRLVRKASWVGAPEVWIETDDKTTRLQDLSDVVDAKVFCAGSQTPLVLFRCECYWHKLPKAFNDSEHDGIDIPICCWFVVPWAIDFLFGTNVVRNFIGKNAPLWAQALEACGLSVHHLRSSRKSRAAKARRVEGKVPVELIINNEADFTITYGGLIALTVYMAHYDKKFSKVLSQDGMSKARLLADILAKWVLAGEALAFKLPECACIIVVTDGAVDLTELYSSQERPKHPNITGVPC